MIAPDNKSLVLGTAQWGWTVDRKNAFLQLDAWLASGHQCLDLATNYPINKIPGDFRKSEKIVQEYIQTHGLTHLDVTIKIGSQDNMRSPDNNLEPSFILMMAMEYRRLFGDNLKGIMIHWDNREDQQAIAKSLEAMASLQETDGIRPGLSGIRRPDLYLNASCESALSFDIQFKHNILQSDLKRYAPFFSTEKQEKAPHRFFAYGLNAGGIKLEGPYPAGSTFLARAGDPDKVAPFLNQIRELLPKWNTAFVRPPVRTMTHIGLLHAGLNPAIDGLVLGFSTVAQLRETLDFWRNLSTFEYDDVFADLQKRTQ
ncbi:MAG: aldo/keto reductase [Lewinellaceae bacterium]|jgi:aryl-alcohol dehydrogenase-like predicted oxidoreductase|nr:aldo/keto reductase [Lewinellaceae bacterium]